jgi:uncharacterized LabA/DUF88 family protein
MNINATENKSGNWVPEQYEQYSNRREQGNDKIAVFIDGDNVSYRDIVYVIDEIKNYGRIICSYVYSDWSQDNMKNMRTTANNSGIIPIQCDRISGKNSSDLKMTIDIMKTLFTIDHISLFYIITSDSDFRHVIAEIKTHNKFVNCIGNGRCNSSLQSICDVFTKMETLIPEQVNMNQEFENVTVSPTTGSFLSIVTKNGGQENSTLVSSTTSSPLAARGGSRSSPPPSFRGDRGHLDSSIRSKYLKDIKIFLSDRMEINLSLIKDKFLRKYQFDFRDYGCDSMYQFIATNYRRELNIEKTKHGMFVTLKENNA